MKEKCIWAITLIIAGLLIAVSASALVQVPQEKKNLTLKRIENSDPKIAFATSKTAEKQVRYSSFRDAIPIDYGYHPAIASYLTEEDIVVGFDSGGSDNVWFTSSSDGGQTWLDFIVGWQIPEPPELPDIDSCGDGRFIGGMVPNIFSDISTELYKVCVTDPSDIWSYALRVWDWSDVVDCSSFKAIAVGGYTAEDPAENAWAFGGHSIIGNDCKGVLQTPLFSYEIDGYGTAAIFYNFANINGCEVTSMDIDQETLFSYAVWNYENGGIMDIYFYSLDFGTWEPYLPSYQIHPVRAMGTINSAGNDDYIDVSALDDNVIIVSERDGDIVVYYSYDGLGTVEESVVHTDAVKPRIVHLDEHVALCIFIEDEKEGSVYFSVTLDGGATWSAPESVVGSAGVPLDYQRADVCGFGTAFESDDIIYFENIDVQIPIIKILSVTGGPGITAVITNAGTKDANDVKYNITIDDGVIIRPRTDSGDIGTLIPGQSVNITFRPIGIGLGLLTPIPMITVTATCAEGSSAEKTAEARIILFLVLL